MSRRRLGCGLLVLCVLAPAGAAEVYRWVDGQGRVHFGDAPPGDRAPERLELRIKAPDRDDLGEQRRQRLLKQADRDAAARLKQRELDRRREEERLAAEAQAAQRCMDLRRQLDILEEQAPVYRDAQGRLRTKWRSDPYQGQRQYLDEAMRAAETGRVRREIAGDCPTAIDSEAQRVAREQQLFAERCEAAHAELQALQRPGSRASDSDLAAKRDEVRVYCGQ